MDETYEERLTTLEKYAIAIQAAFQRQIQATQDIGNESRDINEAMAAKIQALMQSNEMLEDVIAHLNENGLGTASAGGGSVDENQVHDIVEKFFYNDIDFKKVLKNYSTQMFSEVERRYLQKMPVVNQKKSVGKAVALAITTTALFFLSVWGVYVNYKEKPYFQLNVQQGGYIYFQDKTKNQPNVITVAGGYVSPLAEHKNGKYLFYNYLQNGDIAKDSNGEPIVYFIYENDVLNGKVKAIKLGLPQ